jgi:hypothetical protein
MSSARCDLHIQAQCKSVQLMRAELEISFNLKVDPPVSVGVIYGVGRLPVCQPHKLLRLRTERTVIDKDSLSITVLSVRAPKCGGGFLCHR